MLMTITEINPSTNRTKRDGGTYNCFHFKGVKDDGNETEQYIASSFVASNLSLKNQLAALVVGSTYDVQLKKKGMYWNIEGVVPAGTSPGKPGRPSGTSGGRAAGTSGKSSTYVDNSLGMQVGNALTNATNLIAAGVRKASVEEVAEEILRVGERLRANLQAGKYAAIETSSAGQATTTTEDIPFGED